MDFLKQLAVPQSSSQITVLHFVLGFVNIIFLPFVSYLFGALLLSLYYGHKGRKQNDIQKLNFSKDVLSHLIPTKSILVLFGVIPYLAILFGYAQILQHTDAISVSILTWGAGIFALAAAFAGSYNSALQLSSVLAGVAHGSDAVEHFKVEAGETKRTSGKYAIIFLTLSMLLFFSGTTLAANPSAWSEIDTVVELFFSVDVLIRLLQFLLMSLTIASLGTIYFTFSWEGGTKNISKQYADFIKTTTLTIAIVTILFQPLVVAFIVYQTPESGLSGIFFGTSFLAVLFLFIAVHFVYGMLKEFTVSFAGNAFFMFFLVIVFVIVQENSAFSDSTQHQSALLSYEFEKDHEELLTRMGISLNVMTGADIFNAKCSACHEFGKKKVGPAYKDVLPKYENHRDQLVAFISNPVKKNPAFPNMPNQGLKPSEVDSIAAYIMTMYKK
jgi:cytochrome c